MSEDKTIVPSMLKVAKLTNNGWTPEQEELLAEWSDKGLCYRWLHDRTEKKFTRLNAMFTIPIIVLSTLTGTASVGLDTFVPASFQKNAQAIVGGVSIITGIIGTIANFLRYAQGMEAHRSASVSWGKLQRRIATELALAPPQRSDCADFLKLCRAEMDRLIEQNPSIPEDIIAEFEGRFRNVVDVKRPEVCNTLEHTRVFSGNKTPRERLEDATNRASSLMRNVDQARKIIEFPEQVNETIATPVKKIEDTIQEDLERLRASKVVSTWKPLVDKKSRVEIVVPVESS